MSGMLKSGLIGLVVGGIFGLGVTLLMPYCTPCVAVLVGLGVGFLTCLWDHPATGGSGAGLGAQAGAIAGVGHLLGQLLGMVLNGLLVGPEGAVEALAQLGLDTSMFAHRHTAARQNQNQTSRRSLCHPSACAHHIPPVLLHEDQARSVRHERLLTRPITI